MWIDTGSRYETKKNNGVAHFLEHITFKVSCSDTAIILSFLLGHDNPHGNTIWFLPHLSLDIAVFLLLIHPFVLENNIALIQIVDLEILQAQLH